MSVTAQNLLDLVRAAIGDVGEKCFTDAYLYPLINHGIRMAQIMGRAHQHTTTLTLANATADYDTDPIYEVQQVVYDGAPLEMYGSLGAVVRVDPNWDTTADGTPLYCVQYTGSKVKLIPAPNTAAAAKVCKAHGWAVADDDLDATDDTVDSLPDPFTYAAMEYTLYLVRSARKHQFGNIQLAMEHLKTAREFWAELKRGAEARQ